MPWKVTEVLEERTRFVLEFEEGSFTMSELCRIYGIARKTGYHWWRRFETERIPGLQDRRYGAVSHPNQTDLKTEQEILELKFRYPRWGAKKLRGHLVSHRGADWPVLSTFGEILRRNGLTTPQRKRIRVPLYTKPFQKVEAANQLWCADFKGWFRTGQGERIDPLTMTDAHSRYLIRCQSVAKTDTEHVHAIFAAAFREYGLPETIRTDNGPPFASRAIAGMCRLSIYWMKLGIQPERIKPAHPEQNGRHERMHRTLKAETANPPAANGRAQQKAFDRFRQEFNEQRPHEALGQQTPSSWYAPSPRVCPDRVPKPEYDSHMTTKRVYPDGTFFWKGKQIFISKTLGGEVIGMAPIDDCYYTVHFAKFPIGRFDTHKQILQSLPASDGSSHENGGAMESEEK